MNRWTYTIIGSKIGIHQAGKILSKLRKTYSTRNEAKDAAIINIESRIIQHQARIKDLKKMKKEIK